MKYFLDCEFIERGAEHPITLLSIALVAEDGREYYAEPSGVDYNDASDWVKQSVYPHLTFRTTHRRRIVSDIRDNFVGFQHGGNEDTFEQPEFWGYYADYDWVTFCQLLGSMSSLPEGWPKYCRDLKQWCDGLGNPYLPGPKEGEHNALVDARWNKWAYEFLTEYERSRHLSTYQRGDVRVSP